MRGLLTHPAQGRPRNHALFTQVHEDTSTDRAAKSQRFLRKNAQRSMSERQPLVRRHGKENTMPTITTFLAYNDRAEEAVNHYLSIFKSSRIQSITRYGAGAPM